MDVCYVHSDRTGNCLSLSWSRCRGVMAKKNWCASLSKERWWCCVPLSSPLPSFRLRVTMTSYEPSCAGQYCDRLNWHFASRPRSRSRNWRRTHATWALDQGGPLAAHGLGKGSPAPSAWQLTDHAALTPVTCILLINLSHGKPSLNPAMGALARTKVLEKAWPHPILITKESNNRLPDQ